MSDVKFILVMCLFYAFLVFLFNFTDIPNEYKFLSAWDYIWFAGGMVSIAGACVVAPSLTGAIGCPVALAIYTIATVFQYLIITNEVIKFLFFIPLIVTFIFIISKLARGVSG